MNFGQNYFDVLTSRIGGASNIWNRHGTQILITAAGLQVQEAHNYQ